MSRRSSQGVLEKHSKRQHNTWTQQCNTKRAPNLHAKHSQKRREQHEHPVVERHRLIRVREQHGQGLVALAQRPERPRREQLGAAEGAEARAGVRVVGCADAGEGRLLAEVPREDLRAEIRGRKRGGRSEGAAARTQRPLGFCSGST